MAETSLQKRIAERAYQLFLKRGGKHGYHQQDWMQAEKDIRAELAKPAAKAPAKAAPVKAATKAAKAPKAAKKAKKSSKK